MDKRLIIGVSAFLLIIILIFGIYYYKKPKTKREVYSKESLNPVVSENPATIRTDSFPLKRGSKGDNVKSLQKLLFLLGETIAVDGDFGPITEAALKRVSNIAVVSIADFNTLKDRVAKASSGAIVPGNKDSLNVLLVDLKTDLDTWIPYGRSISTENGLYKKVLELNNADFGYILSSYKSKYSSDLSTDIENSLFRDDTGKKIVNRIKII